MNNFNSLFLTAALFSSVTNVALARDLAPEQHIEIAAKPSVKDATVPNDLVPQIQAGGNVFDQTPVGCYAAKSNGKTYLKSLTGDKWIENNYYDAKTMINGIDIYSICTVTDIGLEVVITAKDYTPQIFGVKWESGNAP